MNEIITNVLLIYGVTTLLTDAYGLTVLATVDRFVKEELKNRKYELRNKGSLYNFNEKLGKFTLGFVPFYYTLKALKTIDQKDVISRQADEKIANGEYFTHDENIAFYEEEENNRQKSVIVKEPEVVFEKYKARSNTDSAIYYPVEEPIFDEKVSDELEITPFKSQENIKHNESNKEEDIIQKIYSMDPERLEQFGKRVIDLAQVKNKKLVKEYKEVA